LAEALRAVAFVHLFRREGQEAQAQAEALLTVAHEHGLADWLAIGPSVQGWAFVERALRSGAQEQREVGLVQLREGLAASRTTGGELYVPRLLGALAQGYAQGGQVEEGLEAIAKALAMVEKNEERWNEAELYRLKGELILQQFKVQGSTFNVENPQSAFHNRQLEAEACFLKAIAIAQKQQAKSLELRAATSLARLWQQQALEPGAGSKELGAGNREHETRTKLADAHRMLSEIYNWFTEGFDTKDLQEAKALIDTLSH
jgi:adenylate cyclase